MKTRPWTWSFTRSKLLESCPRAFYYEYYSQGEPFEKEARLLKRLTTLDMLAGQIVHGLIQATLDGLRDGVAIREDLPEQGLALFERQIQNSERLVKAMKQGKLPPQGSQPLLEHYYERELTEEALKRCKAKIWVCLDNWGNSEILEVIKSSLVDNWMPSRADHELGVIAWRLGEIQIFSALDFWLTRENSIYILDWKTGLARLDRFNEEMLQLASYALWACKTLGFAPEQIFVQAAHLLGESRWNAECIDLFKLSKAEKTIREDVFTESLLLAGAEANSPAEALEARPEYHRCGKCKFLAFCDEGIKIQSKTF